MLDLSKVREDELDNKSGGHRSRPELKSFQPVLRSWDFIFQTR